MKKLKKISLDKKNIVKLTNNQKSKIIGGDGDRCSNGHGGVATQKQL